jgi:hypothetical protein
MVAAPLDNVVSPSSMSGITTLTTMVRFIVLSPLGMLAVSALIAPRLQLYTDLVCNHLNAGQWDPENGGTEPDTWSLGSTATVPCAADPVVQAKVAELLTGSSPLCSAPWLFVTVLRSPH